MKMKLEAYQFFANFHNDCNLHTHEITNEVLILKFKAFSKLYCFQISN